MISSSGLTFENINATVSNVTRAREAELKQTLSQLEEPTTQDLLRMQQEVQQWGMFTQIQSTIVKEVAEAMKGVIQKSA